MQQTEVDLKVDSAVETTMDTKRGREWLAWGVGGGLVLFNENKDLIKS